MHGRLIAFAVVLALTAFGIVSFRVGPPQLLPGALSEVISPLERLTSDPTRQLGELVRTIQEMGELRAENARLKDEVAKLRGEGTRTIETARENDLLREQLNLKREQPNYQLVSARVIDRDASNLLRSIGINRGSADGLQMGMTVVAPAGLVGQIVRLGPNTARVLLITDVSSSVTALIQASRAEGVINGRRNMRYLAMTYIPQPAPVKTGDRVVTSGIGGVFPNGLPIGRVVAVSKNDIEPFQEAQVEPEVDFGNLETVLVVTNHVPLRLE